MLLRRHVDGLRTRQSLQLFFAIQEWLRAAEPISDTGRNSCLSTGPTVSFVELWEPIAIGACAALVENISITAEPNVLRDLRDELIRRVSEVAESSVWSHFNSRRSLRDLVLAHTDAVGGEFSRAIYCDVMEELRADGLQSLVDAYPVLRHHLAKEVGSWLSWSHDVLIQVRNDHRVLAETFGFPPTATLTGIRAGLSDPHHGGRTVALLTFTSDTTPGGAPEHIGSRSDTCTVVYKPKNLRIDATYNRLISELPPPTADDQPLPGIVVVCRGEYGYMQYFPHEICIDDDALRRFYRNAGRLTALLYVLGANDCHNENIIAHGDQLFLVDAETLLRGTPLPIGPPGSPGDLDARIGDSVINIGLLPQWFFIGGERIPRDVSALGVAAPVSDREVVPGWVALNSDAMMSGTVERAAHLPTSLPYGFGSGERLSEFGADYCDGFASQLAAIADAKSSWLGVDGHLERFRAHQCRFIRRPTWIYLWMRRQLCEPDPLKSGAAQRLVLAGLHDSSISDAGDAVCDAEVSQMRELDVPFFEQPVDGCDLVLSKQQKISGFFTTSGLDNARRKIDSLDDVSSDLQLALLRGVLAAKQLRAHRIQRAEPVGAQIDLIVPSDRDRAYAASEIAALLTDTAILDQADHVEWLGIRAADDSELSSYGPLGAALYGGRLGIAIFLAAAGRVATDESSASSYHRLATGACWELLRLLESHDRRTMHRWWTGQTLGLAGSGGQLLAAILLSELLPKLEPRIRRGLAALVEDLDEQHIVNDEDLDIVFGCAGVIGPLLKIGTSKAVALAKTAGDRLVIQQNSDGGWVIPTIGSRALTGFSHGASGIAAALARLATVTGSERYLDTAARAIRYERALFDPDHGNWPDLRGSAAGDAGTSFMLSWCHGAPGIALARLCVMDTPLWDADVDTDLRNALTATSDLSMFEDCVCCGRFGRAAILRLAADRLGELRYLADANQLAAQSLDQKSVVGAYTFRDLLGLFQGAAGVGLELLDAITGHQKQAILPSILSAGLIT